MGKHHYKGQQQKGSTFHHGTGDNSMIDAKNASNQINTVATVVTDSDGKESVSNPTTAATKGEQNTNDIDIDITVDIHLQRIDTIHTEK